MRETKPHLRIKSRQMRHEPTDAELKLWKVLRHRQLADYKFRRQHPIGSYIADFACISHQLIIEADGSQHTDNQNDLKRTAALESWGWRVIRFWNTEVLTNTQGVLETILDALIEIDKEHNSQHELLSPERGEDAKT